MKTIRIGTRGSALALAQTEIVRNALLSAVPGTTIDVRVIRTTGDISDEPLSEIGGKGVFVKEIENSLLSSDIDIAVHSLKDMQSLSPDGLMIAAFLKREDPRDMLFSKANLTLQSLPGRARVGTSSLRRICQLKSIRPDLECVAIRGNVQTRLKKIGGEVDAVIIAAAGVVRLGLDPGNAIDTREMIPSPGQGIIAIETRESEPWMARILRQLDDPETRICAIAERAFLARLGADCRIPAAAYAVAVGGGVRLDAMLGNPDGMSVHKISIEGESPGIGARAAEELLRLQKGMRV